MKRVIAKKYVDSKAGIWIAAVSLLLLSLGIGAAIFALIYHEYHLDLDFSGTGELPTPPYGAYILTILLSVGIGAFLFWLMFFLRKRQLELGEDVIVFDEANNVIEVLSGKRYVEVSLDDIEAVKVHNLVVCSAGTVIIPYKTSYGRVTFKYISEGKSRRITSNYAASIEEVAAALAEITKKDAKCGL